MLGPGFLGTRADWLMDLVIVSLVVIVPVILYSWYRVRQQGYGRHKKIQVWLTVTLAIAVLLFEVDLRMSGGLDELTKASGYYGTTLLDASTYIHLFFSVTTSIIWIVLIIVSLRRFPSPPVPVRSFRRTHRFWGIVGAVWMIMTGLTGLELYVLGFAL